jgi:hypothetical protein
MFETSAAIDVGNGKNGCPTGFLPANTADKQYLDEQRTNLHRMPQGQGEARPQHRLFLRETRILSAIATCKVDLA